MSTCPNGHDSASADYCDVCGSPMVAPGAPPAWAGAGGPGTGGSEAGGTGGAGVAPAAGDGWDDGAAEQAGRVCPHCGASSSPSYLFCEDCGYDFTTGALPRPLSEGLAAVDTRVTAADAGVATARGVPPDPADQAGPSAELPVETADPSAHLSTGRPLTTSTDGAMAPKAQVTNGPLAGTPPDQAAVPSAPAAVPSAPAAVPSAPAAVSSAPVAESMPSQPLDPPVAPATGPRPANQAPSRREVGDWVVEVWIDPAWFEVQSSDEACPSPAVPDIVRVRGRALVGRFSASRKVVPDVDCGADSGVSRRHAEFTTDGRRWWVEDLGSSNGTYVGPASGPLPDEPIPPGQRVEIDDDDRIYVGAWTRLVLRRATASEVAGTG